VRNPLAVVRSAAQGLGETLPREDADGHRAASFIVAEVDRLSSVVSSLLAFARPLQLHTRPTVISDVVARAVTLAGAELAAKRVRLARDESPVLPVVHADGDLVCHYWWGSLERRQATPPVARWRAARAATAVELAVADGAGIAPDFTRVFSPSTPRPNGTGLGLAVARQIVEAHGGA
jgi:two-component system sensor histidine kinase HydH